MHDLVNRCFETTHSSSIGVGNCLWLAEGMAWLSELQSRVSSRWQQHGPILGPPSSSRFLCVSVDRNKSQVSTLLSLLATAQFTCA